VTFRLSVTLDASVADAAAGLLHIVGAAGVEVRGEGELPPPGVIATPAGRVELIGFFDTGEQTNAARLVIHDRLGASATVEAIPEEEWGESWKRHFRPVRFGDLVVVPPWEVQAVPAGCLGLVLEPGMAFGTGSHETTALCVRALQRWLGRHPGSSVLDVGTGSGILALAAALLGAGRIVATDNDPGALEVARENAKRAGLEDRVAFRADPVGELEEQFDLVLANILCNTLAELAGPLSGRLAAAGRLVLSGILAEQAAVVAAAYAPAVVEVSRESEGEWMLLELEALKS
jgi:ribosomal protein L11 methyltransferase